MHIDKSAEYVVITCFFPLSDWSTRVQLNVDKETKECKKYRRKEKCNLTYNIPSEFEEMQEILGECVGFW
jgi:hypothetical protein